MLNMQDFKFLGDQTFRRIRDVPETRYGYNGLMMQDGDEDSDEDDDEEADE